MAKEKEEDLQKKTQQLKEWVEKQPHLPKDLDEKLLRRFVHSCYFDMDRAMKALDLFCTFRATSPELLTNRDPLSQPIQKAFKIVNLAHISISGDRKLWIWQLNDPHLENFDYLMDAKLFFLTTDAWLLEDDVLEEADVVLMDVKDISLKFLTKLNMTVAKKLSKYQEDAMPIRLKQIHLVNAPPFIDKIFGIMKPFLKQEIVDMIHFHVPKSESLYEYVSKSELPVDYGGTLPSMEEQQKKVLELTLSKREYFLNDNLWKATVKKSKNKTPTPEVGSFRTLAID